MSETPQNNVEQQLKNPENTQETLPLSEELKHLQIP
jgi:hypothetical protein